MRPLTLGTRGSALALRQAQIVTDALRSVAPGLVIETKTMRTEGDRRQDVSLEAFGGEGVFVKDIEAALLAGQIDLAVHSLKDMPAVTPAGLIIAAVLPRADVRDALVSHRGAPLMALPPNARVGTDSRRRAVQLTALRHDLRPESIRGNVDTRVRKAEAGEYDAVVLAAAGLARLGMLDRASHIFSIDEMLPAAGQGVLAIEAREDDTELLDLLEPIDDGQTRACITAERAYLARLGAGCRLPVAAYAEVGVNLLRLRAMLATDDGRVERAELSVPFPMAEQAGAFLAEKLLAATNAEATP
jgi:hydroxymethylbilane synthase